MQNRIIKSMQKQYSLQQVASPVGFRQRFSEIPYQDLLEQTTLKEFLTALDIVNKESTQILNTDQVDTFQRRKSSFVSI